MLCSFQTNIIWPVQSLEGSLFTPEVEETYYSFLGKNLALNIDNSLSAQLDERLVEILQYQPINVHLVIS